VKHTTTRREVLKKALYAVPAILTLPAHAAFAAKGSGQAAKWGQRSVEKREKP
jgi:hypothetical protein